MITVFLAEGFEEIEAVTPIDILRRGGVDVRTCSITSSRLVTGAHGIPFQADTTISEIDGREEGILLPGGMPGTLHLKASAPLRQRILSCHQNGGLVAAICAAPTVLGDLGILKDRTATCYPGMEKELFCAHPSQEPVVVSGNIITSRGAGTASLFAFRILSMLKGEECARDLARAMVYKGELF